LLDKLTELKDEYNKHLEEKSAIQAQQQHIGKIVTYVTKIENNKVDLALNKCNTHKYQRTNGKAYFWAHMP